MAKQASRRILPGCPLTLGYSLVYLSLLVLIPLSAVFLKSATLSWDQFWSVVTSPRVLAWYRLSFGAPLAGALVNTLFGLVFAWALVRYTFPGKRLVDVLVDLPFALPTAVAGIALTALDAGNGWIGKWFEPLGIKIAFTPLGVVADMAAAAGIPARASRILAFGVTARVELHGNNDGGQHFEGEVTRERVAEIGLSRGQAVRLVPSRRLRVFNRGVDAAVARRPA